MDHVEQTHHQLVGLIRAITSRVRYVIASGEADAVDLTELVSWGDVVSNACDDLQHIEQEISGFLEQEEQEATATVEPLDIPRM